PAARLPGAAPGRGGPRRGRRAPGEQPTVRGAGHELRGLYWEGGAPADAAGGRGAGGRRPGHQHLPG
ncbi:unnamed protein product, partial [Heterosigma akashiwo]